MSGPALDWYKLHAFLVGPWGGGIPNELGAGLLELNLLYLQYTQLKVLCRYGIAYKHCFQLPSGRDSKYSIIILILLLQDYFPPAMKWVKLISDICIFLLLLYIFLLWVLI
jgi:hypothetical protein